jgi:hypothetical protein
MRLLIKRQRWSLTPSGWLLLLLLIAAVVTGIVRCLHPFLAMTDTVHGEILVVEGWTPDYALERAISKFREGGYKWIVTAGVEVEKGFMLSEYKTEAELAAARLRALGFPQESLVVVPAPPEIRTERTFESARAFSSWLKERDRTCRSVDVFTLGAHARRSRLTFERALGDSIRVGIISCEDRRYDPSSWWTTSSGFREVVSEVIAYLYARAKFW